MLLSCAPVHAYEHKSVKEGGGGGGVIYNKTIRVLNIDRDALTPVPTLQHCVNMFALL